MKFIHDGDGAYEDAMALSLLLLNCELIAVTVCYGECNTLPGALNMARICKFLKPEANIPVAYGGNSSITDPPNSFPEFIHMQADNVLQGTDVPESKVNILPDAVEFLKQTLEQSAEKITIVATGPLTNIGELLIKYPECADHIEKIIIMGGAVYVPGNISDLMEIEKEKDLAEWNFFADPVAAGWVIDSPVPIQLVPLDITAQMPMTKEFYESLVGAKEPALKLTFDMLSALKKSINNDDVFYKLHFWDSLTAMIALDPSLVEFKKIALDVNYFTGQSIVIDAEPNVHVALKLHNPQAAYERYKQLLTQDRQFNSRNGFGFFGQLQSRDCEVAGLPRPTGSQ